MSCRACYALCTQGGMAVNTAGATEKEDLFHTIETPMRINAHPRGAALKVRRKQLWVVVVCKFLEMRGTFI